MMATLPAQDRRQRLLLTGSIGVGKTYLAIGMLRALMQERGVAGDGMHAGHHRQSEGVLIDGTGFDPPSLSHAGEKTQIAWRTKGESDSLRFVVPGYVENDQLGHHAYPCCILNHLV